MSVTGSCTTNRDAVYDQEGYMEASRCRLTTCLLAEVVATSAMLLQAGVRGAGREDCKGKVDIIRRLQLTQSHV